jgi:hypothetical protein
MVLKLTYYGTFDSECTFITKYKKTRKYYFKKISKMLSKII